MIYIINFLLVPLYYGLFRLLLPKRKADKWFIWIFAVHAILFRALVYPFDFVDTYGYANAYHNISFCNFSQAVLMDNRYTGWGRGYVAINWLLSRFSRNYMLLFILLSVGTVGGTVWFYAKTSYSYLLTAILYLLYPMLYLMGFAVLRQHLAAVVILLALYNIKNYRVSLPLALLAVLLHTSAIVFLPFFLWRKLKFKRLHSVEIMALTVVVVILMRLLVGYILNVVGLFSSGRNTNFGSQSISSNIMPVIIIGIPVVLALASGLFYRCRGRDYENLNFLAYGFAISLFGIGLYGAGRLTLYFLYVLPVAVTFLGYYCRDLRVVSNLCIAVIFALTIRQVYYMHTSWALSYDYKFYWEMPKR